MHDTKCRLQEVVGMRTRLFEKYVEAGILTMKELAELLGYTPEYLSLIKHGHMPITDGFIGRTCLRLGHRPADLFFDDVPEQTGNSHGGDGSDA